MTRPIRRVAVLGAGTMGAGIAAHVANAGVPVYLLDVVPRELTAAERQRGLTLDSPQVRNRIVEEGWKRAREIKPAHLMSGAAARLVTLGNFSDNLSWLEECDWIVEAVVERLDIKRQLMAQVAEHRTSDAIVSSNTSGIPIHEIAAGLPAEFRQHFLGTHFFNPPRYLKLLEIIPTDETLPEVVARMRDFAENVLGKGVVLCKDAPNFVANRIGTFGGQHRLHYVLARGYTVEEVDALTGPVIGNPKTATFRLLDLVGIDVMAHVTRNLHQAVPDDEMRETFIVPPVVRTMIERGWLGNKSGQGFYKKVTENGQTEYWPLNLETLEYEPPTKPRFDLVGKLRKVESLPERLRLIFKAYDENPTDRAAAFYHDTMLPVLAYAARHLDEIAYNLSDVDKAMRWGFGQQMGPFEIWDALGVRPTVERMRARGIAVPPWVEAMLAAGIESFYQKDNGRVAGYYDPSSGTYAPIVRDPKEINLDELRAAGKELHRNDSASILDLGDGVLCLEAHSKMNTLDPLITAMGQKALELLEQDEWVGLVIGNQGEHFGAGANVALVGMAVMAGQVDDVRRELDAMHELLMRFRFSPKPVVTAPFGLTLGGAAEVAMHGARIVAAAETYMGLVEVGVGLIPAGGGVKEVLRRMVAPHLQVQGVDPLPFLQKAFETIALAKVSTSAAEAREMGFLTEADRIVMNRDHQLGEARQMVLDLVRDGYQPPLRDEKRIFAAGARGRGVLTLAAQTMRWGNFISDHDLKIARQLATVISGGELSAPQWVGEDSILALETEGFLTLVKEPKTLERIGHMLQTGKPLRN
ncbi:MAG: 3-hydroxyacyl-CoA dehydrogenase NAD-binding domain-containing protein [Ardenticatenaceae bacterium]|nr:3-hydroxyacyl-CoA dehydrogenase NAD-binding domain-containing protein [Ardenticatenaceae bacterium]HBY95944.1 3-hydroxyacyl-CoA dehydrogenase [Chloroflexota bacterium]